MADIRFTMNSESINNRECLKVKVTISEKTDNHLEQFESTTTYHSTWYGDDARAWLKENICKYQEILDSLNEIDS